MHWHRSFRGRMRCSTAGTCSSREDVLSVIPIGISSSCRGSNCPSTSMNSRENPRFMYMFLTSLIADRIFVILLGVLEVCHCSELDCTAYSHRKWHLVDFHDIDAQYHLLIVVHNCGWYRYQSTSRSHLVRCLSHCFSFYCWGPKKIWWSKYMLGVDDVFLSCDIIVQDPALAG